MPYICGFDVVYGEHNDEKPEDAIRELSGQDPNINAGFEGKFVWIVAKYKDESSGTSKYDAVCKFDVFVTDESISGRKDLAKGTGGKFRYLHRAPRAKGLASEMALLRTKEKQESAPEGWHWITSDINKGRGGDFLYLVTKMMPEPPSEEGSSDL